MVVMLERLQAEERLAAITDRAVAYGACRRHEASSHMRRLQRLAMGGIVAETATESSLEAMGIKPG